MKNRLKLWLLFLIVLSVTAYLINSTYAIFETNATADSSLEIGKWVIKLNNIDISSGTNNSFIVNNFIYTENSHIKNEFIAPGRSGYFDVILDPTGTDTSVRFDITLSPEGGLPENIDYSITASGIETVMTGPRTYSGVFDLDNINNEEALSIRINITWTDSSEYDSSDTALGIIQNNNISIPIDVYVVQYLGETLEEYEEGSSEIENEG